MEKVNRLNERFNDVAVLRNLYNFFQRKYGDDPSKFVEVAKGLVQSGDVYNYSLVNFLEEIGYELTEKDKKELYPPKPKPEPRRFESDPCSGGSSRSNSRSC